MSDAGSEGSEQAAPAKEATTQEQSRALRFCVAQLACYTFTLALLTPLWPELVNYFTQDLGTASSYWGLCIAVNGFVAFICTPILGSMSDSIGRKPVLVLGYLSLAVDSFISFVAPNLIWFLIGRILSGALSTPICISSAAICDVSTPANKATNLALIGVSLGICFVIGPVLGGVIASVDLRIPFLLSSLVHLTNAALVFFCLPETLPALSTVSKCRRFFNVGFSSGGDSSEGGGYGISSAVSEYRKQYTDLQQSVAMVGIAVVMLLYYFGQQSLNSTFVLYIEHRFSWGSVEVGLLITFMGVCAVAFQGFVLRRLLRSYTEFMVTEASLVVSAMGFLVFSLTTEPVLMATCLACIIAGSMVQPAVITVVSNQVSKNSQGAVIGAFASIETLTRVFGALFASQVFSAFITDKLYFPGAPFLLAAVLHLVSAGLVQVFFSPFARHGHLRPVGDPDERQALIGPGRPTHPPLPPAAAATPNKTSATPV